MYKPKPPFLDEFFYSNAFNVNPASGNRMYQIVGFSVEYIVEVHVNDQTGDYTIVDWNVTKDLVHKRDSDVTAF